MAGDARSVVDRLFEALAARDLDAVAALYASDADVVRYDGAAAGLDEIQVFYGRYLETHGQYSLDQIVQFATVDDVVIWDAMVSTDHGKLLTYDVAILDDAGAIKRHIPTIRGYWGL